MDDVKQAELLAKIKQWQHDMSKSAPDGTSEWDAKDKQRLSELANMDPAEMLTTMRNIHQKAQEDAKMTDCSDEYFAEAKLIGSRVIRPHVPGFEVGGYSTSLYQHPDGQYIQVMVIGGSTSQKIISEKLAGWAKRELDLYKEHSP
jgi:hypothetical protein